MMTDSEIKTNWRNSQKDKAQVQVLADLNSCSVETMEKKLEQLGLSVAQPRPRKTSNRMRPPMPIEFECPGLAVGEVALTLDQLVEILQGIAAEHPGSAISVGRKGEPITGVALLSQFTAGDHQCVEVRLV